MCAVGEWGRVDLLSDMDPGSRYVIEFRRMCVSVRGSLRPFCQQWADRHKICSLNQTDWDMYPSCRPSAPRWLQTCVRGCLDGDRVCLAGSWRDSISTFLRCRSRFERTWSAILKTSSSVQSTFFFFFFACLWRKDALWSCFLVTHKHLVVLRSELNSDFKW